MTSRHLRRHGRTPWTHTCSCGRRSYESRKIARAAVRREHPGEDLHAYECDRSTALTPAWHIGRPRVSHG